MNLRNGLFVVPSKSCPCVNPVIIQMLINKQIIILISMVVYPQYPTYTQYYHEFLLSGFNFYSNSICYRIVLESNIS